MIKFIKKLFEEKTDKKLVSIIVPVYNCENYIADALFSISSQTYQRFECIIVNDGSTDNSLAIIEDFIKRDSRFKVYNIQNSGPGYARNFGIEKANGYFITFMDNDDIVNPNWINYMVKSITKYNSDVVFCYANEFNDKNIYKIPYPRYSKNFYKLDKNLRDSLSRIFFPPWTKLLKKEFLINNNIKFALDNKFDDVLYHFLIMHYANSVSFVTKELYLHRFYDNSITGKSEKNRDLYFDHFKTFKNLYILSQNNHIMAKEIMERFLPFLISYQDIVSSTSTYKELCSRLETALSEENYDEIGCILQRF